MTLPGEEPAADRAMVVVGQIKGPYGVRGWVHVATFTEPADNLIAYQPWFLGRQDGGNWRPVEVAEIRPHKQGFVAKFDVVDDRNAAEALKGCAIGVPETVLGETAEDEFFWRDLIGMEVVDQADRPLGRVTDLMETGAHDVLIVDAGGDENLLIPFHRNHVLEVDVSTSRIRVEWERE